MSILESGSQIVMLLALLAALAFLVEAVVEVLLAFWLKRVVTDDDVRANILKLAGSCLGVLLALMYGIDLLGAVAEAFGITVAFPIVATWAGRVLTGLLMGRGAQWFHDVGTTWLGLDQATLFNRRL
jgi:hypothetical protein